MNRYLLLAGVAAVSFSLAFSVAFAVGRSQQQQHDLRKARRTTLRIQEQLDCHVEDLCHLANLEHICNSGPEEISRLRAKRRELELENRKAEMYQCFKKLVRDEMRQDWME